MGLILNVENICMRYLLIISIFSGVIACNNTPPRKEENISAKIDSLRNEIRQLQERVVRQDSVVKKDNLLTKKPVDLPKIIIKELQKETVVLKNPVKQNKPAEPDSTIYYYRGTKKPSLLITAWKEGRRKLIFYDPSGRVSYEKEDIRLSFTNISEIKSIHPNGAIKTLGIHDNPGASQYWYEGEIVFDVDNEPEWMQYHRMPVESIEEQMNSKYYWDKKERKWVKQQLVREQPVPIQ